MIGLQDCLRPFRFLLDGSASGPFWKTARSPVLHTLVTIHEPTHTITAALEMVPPFSEH
jgi:hypothetical protein